MLIAARRWLGRTLDRAFPSRRADRVIREFTRAWNAAAGDRLTQKHWGKATSTHVNTDLFNDLEELRNRSRFERQNNGILEGIVTSFALDVVGPAGPTLQLQSSLDPQWAEKAEAIWNAWWEAPDYLNQHSGPELLTQAIRSEWDNGESLLQMVTDRSAGPITLRLLAIHPRRLSTPYQQVGNPDVVLGVRRTREGRPLSYWINDQVEDARLLVLGTTWTEVAAQFVIHDFAAHEPGQARGVPLMAPVLDTIAQLRDFERDVMQACRMAAMWAVFFTSKDPNATSMDFTGSTDVEPGTATALPPGWGAEQMTPQQPSQQFQAFRDAKLAEMGRPIGMPLMVVKLDSQKHSYSSARFDGQSYYSVVRCRQRRLERTTLNRCLAEVTLESQRARLLGPAPSDLRRVWVWTPRPHVDPGKEATAQHQRLVDGTQTEANACAENGLDWDAVQTQLDTESQRRDERLAKRLAAADKLVIKYGLKISAVQLVAATDESAASVAPVATNPVQVEDVTNA